MIPILLATAGIVLAFGAAAAGVAAVGRSRAELARWVAQRLRGRTAGGVTARGPREVLASAGAVTALGLLLASTALPAMVGGQHPLVLGAILVAVALPVTILAGYIFPRRAGRRWPDALLRVAGPALRLAGRLLSPVLPSPAAGPRRDLVAVLRETESDGPRAHDQLAMVSLVVGFAERTARDVMTPRTAMVAVREGTPIGEIGQVFAESGYSRLPVYRQSLDDVVGMVHAFDLLKSGPQGPAPIRPVAHVPGSVPLTELLLEMQRDLRHMAIVLDEYGGTAGLATLEDVLGELVGDAAALPPRADDAAPPATLLEIDGSAPLAAVESHFGVRLVTGAGPETVGGYLSAGLGRIPRTGERIEVAGLEFDVVAAGPTRLERVVIRPASVRVVHLSRDREMG